MAYLLNLQNTIIQWPNNTNYNSSHSKLSHFPPYSQQPNTIYQNTHEKKESKRKKKKNSDLPEDKRIGSLSRRLFGLNRQRRWNQRFPLWKLHHVRFRIRIFFTFIANNHHYFFFHFLFHNNLYLWLLLQKRDIKLKLGEQREKVHGSFWVFFTARDFVVFSHFFWC